MARRNYDAAPEPSRRPRTERQLINPRFGKPKKTDVEREQPRLRQPKQGVTYKPRRDI